MVNTEEAHKITTDFVKKKRNVEKVDIITTEEKPEGWIVKGSCPIDVFGHPWMERFEVVIDLKGKVKDSHFGLM
jgi:hypothetical protein